MHTVNRTPRYATTKPIKPPSLCQDWSRVPMILITSHTSIATLPRRVGGMGDKKFTGFVRNNDALRLQVSWSSAKIFYRTLCFFEEAFPLPNHKLWITWLLEYRLLGQSNIQIKEHCFFTKTKIFLKIRSWISYKPVGIWGCLHLERENNALHEHEHYTVLRRRYIYLEC